MATEGVIVEVLDDPDELKKLVEIGVRSMKRRGDGWLNSAVLAAAREGDVQAAYVLLTLLSAEHMQRTRGLSALCVIFNAQAGHIARAEAEKLLKLLVPDGESE